MSKPLFTVLVVLATLSLLLVGCNRYYSAAPQATPTLLPPEFSSPLPNDPMAMIAATATALAGGMGMMESPTPPPDVETPTPTEMLEVTPSETPQDLGTPTPTPPFIIVTPPAPVETTPTNVLPTLPPVAYTPGSVPSTYTLRQGEFPYCIARRFNLDPTELLQLNGLSDGMIYQPGLVLRLPQTGNPFPGERALKPHPTSYTVSKSNQTIYAVACEFGDVFPEAIASANGLPLSEAPLQVSLTLNIP